MFDVNCAAGSALSHVYFPTTSIVSLLYVMQNGESAEITVAGKEGVVGVSLFMGGDSTPAARECSAMQWSRKSTTDAFPTG